MTSTPPTPRPPRGQVPTYGQHRTCADGNCPTVLSRYNKTNLCWKHEDERWRRGRR
jgi:hypothetical protein